MQLVMGSASILAGLGCIPMPIQPFVMTPMPALIHPVFASIPSLDGRIPESFVPVFVSCAGCMTAVICVSLFAIYLGPLFGIIRENSTFGEVVRTGDSKRKRWFRLRLHIQRPSEIAFFYENRSDAFRRNEGFIRWGIGFCGLVLLLGISYLAFVFLMSLVISQGGAMSWRWWVYEFHTIYLTIHGCGLVLAIFVFSHAQNSTYLRIPFVCGKMAEVSRMDTRAFFVFALLSTSAALAVPFQFEHFVASPNGMTIFPDLMFGTQVVDLGEVFVGPTTTRRFSSIQALPNWYECFATLSDGETILWRRELNLATGSEFDANHNFALLIDHGRKLHLPGGASDMVVNPGNEISTVSSKMGRPIRCLTVKPWQVPNHSGPLVVAQAVIFPEDAAGTDLNRTQWRAVATWMCQGGTVFLHKDSREIIDRLTHAAPLDEEAPFPSGVFTVRRIGLGAIYEYPQPLFSITGSEIKSLIGETTALLNKNDNSILMRSGYRADWSGRADVNRVMVVVFLGLYAVLSGVGAFLQFRVSQRRLAAYTVVVVVASFVAGILGGFLRFSKGDLSWVTVTQVGAGGAVQSGRIVVQSAGGRNKRVAINGQNPDLQFVEERGYNRYARYRQSSNSYAPFTWQPNLAKGADDTYQINVPITPWGRRRIQAAAFNRDLRRMEFELDFKRAGIESDADTRQEETPGMPRGAFSLKLVNHLPFRITNCMLVIGVTSVSPLGSGLMDVYQIQSLPDLPAGGTYKNDFQAELRVFSDDWEMTKTWQDRYLIPPRISRLGTAEAWMIGHIENSPSMTINGQRSDFVPRGGFHIFVQKILPEDMSAASVFLDGMTNGAPAVEENRATNSLETQQAK